MLSSPRRPDTTRFRRAAPARSCFRDGFLYAGKVTERLTVWGTGACLTSALAPRDNFIGWTLQLREKNLPLEDTS